MREEEVKGMLKFKFAMPGSPPSEVGCWICESGLMKGVGTR